MKKIFLFTELAERSPLRVALHGGPWQIVVRTLRGTWLDCPISIPPDLVLVEPSPHRNVQALIPVVTQHPVVGRVAWLLVLDPERVHQAAGLPCHDFLVRGFSPAEALSRVERLLEHRPDRESLVRSGPVTIDLRGSEVRLNGGTLALPNQEFALLRHFAQNPGQAFSRDALLASVWGPDYQGGHRTVDIHVRRLRAKLGDAAGYLQTVRQIGYRWAAP